jgi:FkbM family methyltransferase
MNIQTQVETISSLARSIPQFRGKAILFRLLYQLARTPTNEELVAKLPVGNGVTVLVYSTLGSIIESCPLLIGCYEPEISWLTDLMVRPGDTVMDLGANVGFHTLRLANRVAPTGVVYAFEPNPEVRAKLIKNLELNRLRNVRVIPDAASDSCEETTLYVNPRGFANRNATMVHDTTPEIPPIPYAIRTLRCDDLWKTELRRERISFIKMDVEGYELKALQGAEELISTWAPNIVLEYNRHYASLLGYSTKELRRFFDKYGSYRAALLRGKRLASLEGEPKEPISTLAFISAK